jgi:tripartite-type tricarboxylate transporter receptor subunit TctC
MHAKHLRRWFTASATLLALACTSAHAAWPEKAITIVVGSAAGGGTDFVTRSLTEGLSAELGQPVLVDNRGGSAGFVAAEFVRRAPPDGYTLMVAPDDVVNWRALGVHKSINIAEDLEPVALLGTVDFFLVVSGTALAAKTPADLIRMAKENPGQLSYASPGVGSPQNLGMELFKQKTNTDFIHVPYKGMAPAVPDVLAGRVQVMITGYPTFSSHLESGKIRVLGAANSQRSAMLPQVPTLAEQGAADVGVQGYFSLLAPKGMPPAVLNRINAAVNKVLASASVRDALTKRAIMPVGGTPAQLRDKLRMEVDKWSKVVQEAGIKPE